MKRAMLTTVLAITLAVSARPGIAQSPAPNYPTQNIRMIISFGAGGGSDIIGRIVAQRLQDKLGQTVVVENRAGAGGLLGNEAIANAPKDGYTVGVQTAGQIIAKLDDSNSRAQLEQANAQYRQAQANMAAAQTAYDDAKPIFERNQQQKQAAVISLQSFDEAQAQFIVLGLGAAVRVLEPESLRNWVEAEAKEVAGAAKEC